MSNVKQRHLGGLNIAFLMTPGASHDGLEGFREALEESGAMVKVLAARKTVDGGDGPHPVDLAFEQARADDFDGAVVGGGDAALKTLGENQHAARLLRGLEKEGKPLAVLGRDDAGDAPQAFLKSLAERTRDSVRGTADDLPGSVAMGG